MKLILKIVDWLSVLWNRLRGRVRADHLNRKDRRLYEKTTGRRILGTNKPLVKTYRNRKPYYKPKED